MKGMDFVQGRNLRILCVIGGEHEYHTAEVYLDVRGQAYQMIVDVVERLSHAVVIGQDICILPELMQASKPVNVVVTRSQSRAKAFEEETEDPAVLTTLRELPFAIGEIAPPARVRGKKSGMQVRRDSGHSGKKCRVTTCRTRCRLG